MVDARWSVVPIAFPSGTSHYPRTSLGHGAVLIATVTRTAWPTRAGPCLAHSSRETLGKTKEKMAECAPRVCPPPSFPPRSHIPTPSLPTSKSPAMQAWPDLFGGLDKVGCAQYASSERKGVPTHRYQLAFWRGPGPPLFFALFEKPKHCARRWREHTHSPVQECPRANPNWLA